MNLETRVQRLEESMDGGDPCDHPCARCGEGSFFCVDARGAVAVDDPTCEDCGRSLLDPPSVNLVRLVYSD